MPSMKFIQTTDEFAAYSMSTQPLFPGEFNELGRLFLHAHYHHEAKCEVGGIPFYAPRSYQGNAFFIYRRKLTSSIYNDLWWIQFSFRDGKETSRVDAIAARGGDLDAYQKELLLTKMFLHA